MSKTRDALRYPVYQPRNWGVPAKRQMALPEPWYGLDTERNTQPGHPIGEFVCAWIDNNKESKAFKSFRDLPPGTYWVWNVAYDIEGLVRDMGNENGWAMREDGTPFEMDGARCIYYHGKRFEWKDDAGRRIFLEGSSFFNRIPLKEALKALCSCKCKGCVGKKAHCGGDWETCPTKDPVDASKMSLKRYLGDEKYRAIVDEYCRKDARAVWRLMDFLRKGFADLGTAMGGEPIPIGGTPGSTARRLLRGVPPFPKVIWSTHKPFLETYCGGRFEILKRGVFENARQYDLISAYPWALSNCPMLTQNATHRFTRRVSDEALYGAYEISFKTDEYLGVMPGWRGGTRVYSGAEEKGWMSRPELLWLQERGHPFEIHRGVEVFDENATDGWRQLVTPIFGGKDGHAWTCPAITGGECNCNDTERKQRKTEPLALGAKVGVNSLYGILIQLIQKGGVWVPIEEATNPVDFAGFLALEKGPKAFDAGQFYAPVYSSTLTSMVRVRVLDAALEIGEENAVASHTDSMLGVGKGRLKEGGKLGDWKLEKEAPELVILKSGQYAIGDTVKGRGFSKRKLNPLDEDEMAVRQKVDLWAQQHTRRTRVGVKTAGGDWRNVSVIKDKVVANNIGWELKRKWANDWSAREIERRLIQGRTWMDSAALRNLGKIR